MANLESSLKNASYFRCEKGNDSVPVCQRCETCVLARKIFFTKEWFQRIGEIAQRRFLVSILEQLDSFYLLHYFQTILQSIQGKDFIYNRSRIDLSRKEGKTMKSSLNQMLSKTVEQKMRELLCWFGTTAHQTKAKYTLSLLQMCNPQLLLTAATVVRVLFQREQNNISGLDQDSNHMFFFPEKDCNSQFDTLHVYRTARTKNTSFPLSKDLGKERLHKKARGEASNTEGRWKGSLQCISEMNRLFPKKADMHKTGHAPSDLLVDMDAVRDLSSGVSKYRDFIRHLPIHLSKYILSMLGCTGAFIKRPPTSTQLEGSHVYLFFSFFSGMLDKKSLNRCSFVSQHWAVLAQQVRLDRSMHTFIQNRIALLQGSYTRGIDPNYANKLSIPVPKMTDDGKRIRVKNQKWKLRTKSDYNLWTAYQNQETQQVQMEERNVFCGTYNIRIVSDVWDRNRIIHYSGGDLVAVSSNRKIQLLDILQVKEVPVEFRGHAGRVRALFLCEQENFLLSGSYDLSIRYWDLKSGACIRIFNGHQGTITCIDLYKNKLVSGARDCQVKEWDIETGKCLKTFKHKDPILATRINDTYIVSSCERGLVKVWHIAMAQLVKTLSGHEGAVKCLCFDEWHLLSGSTDGLVIAWSMVGKYERCLMAYKHPKEVLHVALLFLRVISSCADGKIRIYNFLNGNCLKVMKANGRGDPVLSFFIQGNRMVINTESNILMFQFENIKWQYFQERAKQRKNKDREEDREESSLTEVLSKASTQAYSLKASTSSKQVVALESLLSKPHRSRVLLRAARFPSDDVEKVPKQELETPGDLTSPSNKKSWQIPMLPDRFLLTINALQQAHNSREFAYPRRPQTQVIDTWVPSISHPRKVLSFKGKSIQHAVDRLRASHPPIDVKQTSIPLEIQTLQPNLKKSLHSSRVQSTIPQRRIIHTRLAGRLEGEDRATGSVDRTVRSVSPLTSMQVIMPNRMLPPPVSRTTQSVKKERPRLYTALNPFRVNTEFMLLTVREEKEYEEAKMKEYQARKLTGVVNPDKARKAAWIRKIKGLPIDNFMKQGKTAAPELGQNVFI
ncbi:F-box and WD repeat domain containing protein 10B isoform X2 [Pteronotus mesoamericanus]|uniref:F-box and WD repeat domain containing protein 10B isoform X2 n=1 Tax=Pteronotus mesoamericanus TaxID=1884717 RepID=UPI0023EB7EC7|nr:F-box and WD repeat domain containing protein 10B isoform X2 [Pteronotus parnellii mesoamericanus]